MLQPNLATGAAKMLCLFFVQIGTSFPNAAFFNINQLFSNEKFFLVPKGHPDFDVRPITFYKILKQ